MDINEAKMMLLQKTKDMVIITKAYPVEPPHGPEIVWVNDAFCQVTGYTPEEVIGGTPRILQGKDTDKVSLYKIKQAISKRESINIELINYSKDKTPYWISFTIAYLYDEAGQLCYLGAIERDITVMKMMTLELYQKSVTDPLTQAYNRETFFTTGDTALQSIGHSMGLLFFDIDNFKAINDIEGHVRGDEVLKLVVDECKKITRRSDKVFRYGGDEFAILMFGVDESTLGNKADMLINNLAKHNISISIGGTLSRKTDASVSEMILRADASLYKIKKSHKGQFLIE